MRSPQATHRASAAKSAVLRRALWCREEDAETERFDADEGLPSTATKGRWRPCPLTYRRPALLPLRSTLQAHGRAVAVHARVRSLPLRKRTTNVEVVSGFTVCSVFDGVAD